MSDEWMVGRAVGRLGNLEGRENQNRRTNAILMQPDVTRKFEPCLMGARLRRRVLG